MLDALAAIQTARMQAEAQLAVNVKLLQIVRDQGQSTVKLLEDAAEDLTEAIEDLTSDVANQIDLYI